jgi:hypothetical protein
VAARGTQFTCFTGTKVQIMTQKALLDAKGTGEDERGSDGGGVTREDAGEGGRE